MYDLFNFIIEGIEVENKMKEIVIWLLNIEKIKKKEDNLKENKKKENNGKS